MAHDPTNDHKEEAMSTTTAFDLDRFARAAEERDASTQLSMYGPGAVVTIADKVSQPGSPRVLRTHEEIRSWLEDMYSRDMTHSLTSFRRLKPSGFPD
jgi:hypothetical protein